MDQLRWYALRVAHQHESAATAGIVARGVEVFYPSYRSRRVWSDRSVVIESPLFPGYVFGRFVFVESRTTLLRCPGVRDIIKMGSRAAPVPEEDIQAVRRLVASGLALGPCPFLNLGDRVCVRRGPLRGLEGIIASRKGRWELVVNIAVLQRGARVVVALEDVERIAFRP